MTLSKERTQTSHQWHMTTLLKLILHRVQLAPLYFSTTLPVTESLAELFDTELEEFIDVLGIEGLQDTVIFSFIVEQVHNPPRRRDVVVLRVFGALNVLDQEVDVVTLEIERGVPLPKSGVDSVALELWDEGDENLNSFNTRHCRLRRFKPRPG